MCDPTKPEPLGLPICVRLPESIDAELRGRASRERRPFAQFIRNIICDGFEHEPTDEERKAQWDAMSPEEQRLAASEAEYYARVLGTPSPWAALIHGGPVPVGAGECVRAFFNEHAPLV